MIPIRWSEMALAGLERLIAPERVPAARKAIDLKLGFAGGSGLRRLTVFGDRPIYVFTLFAGVVLRIVVEIGEDAVVWHVGRQPDATG
jgi:hypothetical protein